MFTVCPKCMLTLAVTAADLRMGQGYVRCGRCANVFNALLTLSEEPVEEHATPPAPADPASQSQITAALREQGASERHPPEPARESAPAPTPEPQPSAPGQGPAQLPVELSSDGGIENASTFADGTGTFETIVLEGEAITSTEEYVPEESIDSEIASLTRRLEANAQRVAADSVTAVHTATAAPADEAAMPATPVAPGEAPAEAVLPEEPAAVPTGAAAPGPESATEASPPEATAGEFARPEHAARARWAWIAGGTLLTILLLLQMAHHWRDALARNHLLQGPLTRLYAALGMPLDPHWDLAAYDVHQRGAAADASDAQLVHVRLSLANHAERAQPLPLLRLTLLDRFGKRIARGELTPAQYWPGGHPPGRLLARDERVDCDVAVRDPGAESASFELDVCLRDAGGILRCAADLPRK